VPDHAVRFRLAATDLAHPCRPYDIARDGISVGEGAAFALLERAPENPPAGSVLLLGTGESSDAYHMSAPHPEGLGARMAMASALRSAHLSAADIDYINLHGTATPANDAAEGKAVGRAVRQPACRAVRPRAPPATRWAQPARSKP
jgi:3-oxoacyl-(acyl-carrier-protein) synthase